MLEKVLIGRRLLVIYHFRQRRISLLADVIYHFLFICYNKNALPMADWRSTNLFLREFYIEVGRGRFSANIQKP